MIQRNPKRTPDRRWTARELRQLSEKERDAILHAAAAEAEQEYRTNKDLTSFEAVGQDDMYGESSSSETR